MKKIFILCLSVAVCISTLFAAKITPARADEQSFIDVSSARTIYFIGDSFDDSGIEFEYNGFKLDADRLTVDGFSSATVGVKRVKLSYKELEISYSITVYNKVKQIRFISVTHKTDYFVNEIITVADMKIQLVYENDQTKNVNVEPRWIKGFDSSAPCEKQTLTIDFGGITTTYDVTIKPIELAEENFVKTPLGEADAEALSKADNSGVKIAFFVVWSVFTLVILGGLVLVIVKKARGDVK